MLNQTGIEILNNSSRIIDNLIAKAHENGIKVTGNDRSTRATPIIWRNQVNSSQHNGIICTGEQCEPDIRGNIVIQNRKAGIKLNENAQAHIGGTTKVDIKFIPTVSKSSTSNATFQTAKVQAAKVLLTGDENYEDITSKDDLVINVKSFPNPNVIQANYN